MALAIVQKEDKVLREKAKEVPISAIDSAKIKKVITDMKKALAVQHDGVAIAAPQIGVSLRIFVVSGRVFADNFETTNYEEIKNSKKNKDMVFINPKIIKLSRTKEMMPEGCLSVRWIYGNVKRSTNATIEARDENGQKFTRGAGGILAQIFQHETDHLDGILFIDKAKDMQDLPPKNVKK